MISFVIITKSVENNEYLNDCLASLPQSEEIIIVETHQTNEGRDYLDDFQFNDKRTFAKYKYDGAFDFSKARNYAKKLATQDWIFSIDDDERLLMHQHSELLHILQQLPENVLGLLSANIGNVTEFKNENGTFKREFGVQCRIFRNNPLISWEFPIHEQVIESIKRLGGTVHDTNIIIHHVGYVKDTENIIKKINRNLAIYNSNENLLQHEYFKSNKIDLEKKLFEVSGNNSGDSHGN